MLLAGFLAGCRSPGEFRDEADATAYEIIQDGQQRALGKTEAFTIETPAQTLRRRLLLDQELPVSDPASLNSRNIEGIEQWPDAAYLDPERVAYHPLAPWNTGETLRFSQVDSLQVAARNSREYQNQKESVYESALRLDLQKNSFRNIWKGALKLLASSTLNNEEDSEDVHGGQASVSAGLERKFRNGASVSINLGLDVAKLLSGEEGDSTGLFGDGSISIPLMRGSGEFVVTEPLTQAERDLIYAIYGFERFKQTFAVSIADEYLRILGLQDAIDNARDNYSRVIRTTRSTRREKDAGITVGWEVDQAIANELSARSSWISSVENHRRALDSFKLTLGLPPDAAIELDPAELDSLVERKEEYLSQYKTDEEEAEVVVPPFSAPVVFEEPIREGGGKYEFNTRRAVELALGNRLDLRVLTGRILDAQRKVAVAADQLRSDLTLLGNGAMGGQRSLSSANLPDVWFELDKGQYSGSFTFDPAIERTNERNLYRGSLIAFEDAVRSLQALEDQIKLDIRNGLSRLFEDRESIRIQNLQVKVAERRLASSQLSREAGRIDLTELLAAQASLVQAQDSLTSALVNYRVGELQIQRDMGILDVNEQGLWTEFDPEDEGS